MAGLMQILFFNLTGWLLAANDPQHLIADTKKAVDELSTAGVTTFCLSLDPKADAYVSDMFGSRYTVIDHVQRLPERLPKLFMALTR